MTVLEVVLLWFSGFPLYDAVCNSLTTLAAGGFSPNPESIGGYRNPMAEWIVIVFMFLAGANYLLQYQAIRGRPSALFRDEEFRAYTLTVVVFSVLLAGALWLFARHPSPEYLAAPTALGVLADPGGETIARQSIFQVLTIITTTGFATDDFNLWGDRAKILLFVLMFVGGSAGSAGGGPKIVRILLLFKYAGSEILRAIHPQAVRPVRLNGRIVPPQVVQAILSFFLLYLLIYLISVVLVVGMGAELVTGMTACIATLGNIGPGFSQVGPMASFADFPVASKLVLFMNMWIGRLEVMTVLLLLHPRVWRTARWKE